MSGEGLWLSLASTLLALALVLLLAWGVLKLLKRTAFGQGAAADDAPKVRRAVSLGARERLVVVEHRGVEYLLGVTAAQVSVVDRRVLDAAAGVDGEPG